MLFRLNLNGNYSGEYSPYGALPWDPACQGEDWARNIELPNIDLASLHYYPGNGLYENDVATVRVGAELQMGCEELMAVACSNTGCMHIWVVADG